MRIKNFGRALLAGFALLAASFAVPAAAQDYPNKPIKVIVPFAAGGGNDIFARLVGQKAGEILGQTLVIENRVGAGGRPAAEWVTQQPHDGYTLFVGASGVMSVAVGSFSEPSLPSDQELRPAVDDRRFSADRRDPGRPSCQDGEGTGRVGEEES